MIFVLRKKSAFEREKRMAFHSPEVCVCGLVVQMPQVISQHAANEGW